MKVVSREFWVSDDFIRDIKIGVDISNRWLRTKSMLGAQENKITISWELPEKKVEISESEFDKLFESVAQINLRNGYSACPEYFKEKLFGDK